MWLVTIDLRGCKLDQNQTFKLAKSDDQSLEHSQA